MQQTVGRLSKIEVSIVFEHLLNKATRGKLVQSLSETQLSDLYLFSSFSIKIEVDTFYNQSKAKWKRRPI